MHATGRALGVIFVLVVMMTVSAVAGRLFLPELGSSSDPDRSSAQAVVAPAIDCPRTTIVGRYYSDTKPSDFLEFRTDGTVFMSTGAAGSTYAVDGATVIISTTIFGAARGTMPQAITVPACHYSGPSYDRLFFPNGVGTIQGALSGWWSRRN